MLNSSRTIFISSNFLENNSIDIFKNLTCPNHYFCELIISPDESQGYIGFTSVVPPPYVLICVRDNSKTLSQISFKLGTHMYLGQERNPILR